MIQVIPSEARYTAQHDWLTSRFSFSFADYYDPSHMNFGALRVFNDDVVQPGNGFGLHPHANFEIMSYVLEGTLEHKDNMGNRSLLRPGEIQCTTAGTGIYHSESNPSSMEVVHFLQIWFTPSEKNLPPKWEQRAFPKETQLNRLLPVVSGRRSMSREDLEGAGDNGGSEDSQGTEDEGKSLHVHQDVTVYLSVLEGGRTLTHVQAQGRRMYLFVIQGDVQLQTDHTLHQGDSARIEAVTELRISTTEGAEFMLMDLA